MASPQDSCTVSKMGFSPLDPVGVPIGRMTVKLYPKITAAMPVYERAHAFQVNKSALKDLPTNFWLVIDAFGTQLNSSSTVEGILSNWRRFFSKRWIDFSYLTILSFHQLNGNRIDNTTTAGDSAILLPVVDGAYANCCQQDVRFVQVQCNLDFADLTTTDTYPVSTILRVYGITSRHSGNDKWGRCRIHLSELPWSRRSSNSNPPDGKNSDSIASPSRRPCDAHGIEL